mgnify:CR=1 FL=1
MKIKEYRILKGYTQSEIANILNIKQSSFQVKRHTGADDGLYDGR